jgi:hypothetical protein
LWLKQGRTDAWIAHKLDISVGELEQFKRDHRLDGEPPPPVSVTPPLTAEEPEPEEVIEAPAETREEEEEEEEEAEEQEIEVPGTLAADEPTARRRRSRRGGRRRGGRRPSSYEATFDHGEEGYGLWLDPGVADDPIYAEHWAGHRPVSVTLEADSITIRRTPAEEES